MYSQEFDIVTQILFGQDLPLEWKRLIIVKKALHVFDTHQVDTPDDVRKLIPAVIPPELKSTTWFGAAVDDYFGLTRQWPFCSQRPHKQSFAQQQWKNGTRTSTEIADFVQLPDYYVGMWLEGGM